MSTNGQSPCRKLGVDYFGPILVKVAGWFTRVPILLEVARSWLMLLSCRTKSKFTTFCFKDTPLTLLELVIWKECGSRWFAPYDLLSSVLVNSKNWMRRSGLSPGWFTIKHRQKWKEVQYLSDVFWLMWTREYLLQLQEQQKWLQPKGNLQTRNLVLISSENPPRNLWQPGLIVQVNPGEDGLVRSDKIKT